MPAHRKLRPERPVYLFANGEEPPAELIAAARRGECWVLHGQAIEATPKVIAAFRAWADARIAQDDEALVVVGG